LKKIFWPAYLAGQMINRAGKLLVKPGISHQPPQRLKLQSLLVNLRVQRFEPFDPLRAGSAFWIERLEHLVPLKRLEQLNGLNDWNGSSFSRLAPRA
jgi:hypothetical protein